MLRYDPAFHQAAAIEIECAEMDVPDDQQPRQLQEKMTLFWHMIFCAGHSKIDSGEEMLHMIAMFREHGMGNFQDLLMKLSTFPGHDVLPG